MQARQRRFTAPKRNEALQSQIGGRQKSGMLGERDGVGLEADCPSAKAEHHHIAPLFRNISDETLALKLPGLKETSIRTMEILEKMRKISEAVTQGADTEANADADGDGDSTKAASCTARIEKLEKANARLHFSTKIQEHELDQTASATDTLCMSVYSLKNDVDIIKLTNMEQQKSIEERNEATRTYLLQLSIMTALFLSVIAYFVPKLF